MTDPQGGGSPPDGGWGGGTQPPGGPPGGSAPGAGWGQAPPGAAGPPGGPGPGWFEQVAASGYVPDDEERKNAFYTHLFAAIGALVSCACMLGIAGAFLPLLLVRQKTPFFLFHLNQSVLFQVSLFAIAIAINVVGTVLAAFTCLGAAGPALHIIPWVTAIVYPLVVGLNAKEGEWAAYPVLGTKLMTEWKPIIK